MATVLFAWELGSGLGHLTQMAPLANGLATRGHRVLAAVRDVGRAPVAFDPAVKLLAAASPAQFERPTRVAHSFAHVLADVGWTDAVQLRARAGAWRNVFELVRPDLIVFDHSPTALLAARACLARRAVIGNGFTLPADCRPMPNLRTWLKVDEAGFGQEEDALRANANAVLREWGLAPLGRLGQLYSQVDLTLLATLPELDPYGKLRPPGTRYFGAVNPKGGKPPNWPAGGDRKVFVYLRGCPAAEGILKRLRERNASVIAVVGGLSPRQRDETNWRTPCCTWNRTDLTSRA